MNKPSYEELELRIKTLEQQDKALKELEKNLRREVDFLRAAYRTTPALIVTIDANGKTVMMNDAMLNALRYSSNEVIGTDYLTTFVPERSRETLTEIFRTLITTRESTVSENPVLTKDGSEIDVEWHGSQLFDEQDKFEFFFGVGIDITERKKIQNEKQQLQNLLENMIESMPSIIVGVDSESKITQWNREAEKILVTPKKKAIGQSLSDLVPLIADYQSQIQRTIQQRKILKTEKIPWKLRDLETYWGMTVYPLLANGDEGAVVRLDDMSDQVRLEGLKLRQTRIEAEISAATTVQQSLLPKEIPHVHGFQISSVFLPAREISGDFYDIVKLDERYMAIVIADVSGKGIAAAMYANMAKILLKEKVRFDQDPMGLLCQLNTSLQNEFQPNSFITVSYILLDSINSTIAYTSAGHEPLILVKKNEKSVRELKPSGYPLCAVSAESFKNRIAKESCRLDKGDILFLYTDGLTDAFNERGEQFGADRLLEIFLESKNMSAKAAADNVIQTVSSFQGNTEQSDDMTLIVLKKE